MTSNLPSPKTRDQHLATCDKHSNSAQAYARSFLGCLGRSRARSPCVGRLGLSGMGARVFVVPQLPTSKAFDVVEAPTTKASILTHIAAAAPPTGIPAAPNTDPRLTSVVNTAFARLDSRDLIDRRASMPESTLPHWGRECGLSILRLVGNLYEFLPLKKKLASIVENGYRRIKLCKLNSRVCHGGCSALAKAVCPYMNGVDSCRLAAGLRPFLDCLVAKGPVRRAASLHDRMTRMRRRRPATRCWKMFKHRSISPTGQNESRVHATGTIRPRWCWSFLTTRRRCACC